jgi:hypothetical protein
MATVVRRGRDYWEGVVVRWRSTGQSMLGYARERNLSYSQLVRWRRRIEAQQDTKPRVTLIPVGTVAVANSSPGVVVRVTGDIEIEVGRGFDAEVLAAVVRALRGVMRC